MQASLHATPAALHRWPVRRLPRPRSHGAHFSGHITQRTAFSTVHVWTQALSWKASAARRVGLGRAGAEPAPEQRHASAVRSRRVQQEMAGG